MQWLADIIEWVANWFPRITLLQVNQGGVKFLPGGKTKVIKPGLYMHWPVTTNIETLATKRRGVAITQRLTTADEITVLAQCVVRFHVEDVHKALVETFDFDDTILETAQEAVIAPVMLRTFTEACEAIAENGLRSEITPPLRKALRVYGVYVERAFISDFSRTKVICHEGSINTGSD